MTYGNLRTLFLEKLSGQYNIREANNLFYEIVEHYSRLTRALIVLHFTEEVPETALNQMLSALELLQSGKPLQYIIGISWFNNLRLTVTPAVLIPRQETMQMCTLIEKLHLIAGFHAPFRILDIGTGSGCIAIDLKLRFPLSTVTAIDISSDAIEVAELNARMNKAEITFVNLDISDSSLWNHLDDFELIVSNPPYIPVAEIKEMKPNVTENEPFIALFVPDNDPLRFYKLIFDFARSHLVAGGAVYVEIHENFGQQIHELACKYGFPEIMILNDLNDRPRFARAVTAPA